MSEQEQIDAVVGRRNGAVAAKPAAKPARPLTVGWVLCFYGFCAFSAAVLGFCAAVAYATFVKTCHVLGVG